MGAKLAELGCALPFLGAVGIVLALANLQYDATWLMVPMLIIGAILIQTGLSMWRPPRGKAISYSVSAVVLWGLGLTVVGFLVFIKGLGGLLP